jgi:hypothetical protein
MSEKDFVHHYRVLKQFLDISDDLSSRSKLNSSRAARAREKLLKLSSAQFRELSTDVYDELKRRIDESRGESDYLLPKSTFHPKRNQARQKLASLPQSRFKDLVSDISFEIERRELHIDSMNLGSSIPSDVKHASKVSGSSFGDAFNEKERLEKERRDFEQRQERHHEEQLQREQRHHEEQLQREQRLHEEQRQEELQRQELQRQEEQRQEEQRHFEEIQRQEELQRQDDHQRQDEHQRYQQQDRYDYESADENISSTHTEEPSSIGLQSKTVVPTKANLTWSSDDDNDEEEDAVDEHEQDHEDDLNREPVQRHFPASLTHKDRKLNTFSNDRNLQPSANDEKLISLNSKFSDLTKLHEELEEKYSLLQEEYELLVNQNESLVNEINILKEKKQSGSNQEISIQSLMDELVDLKQTNSTLRLENQALKNTKQNEAKFNENLERGLNTSLSGSPKKINHIDINKPILSPKSSTGSAFSSTSIEINQKIDDILQRISALDAPVTNQDSNSESFWQSKFEKLRSHQIVENFDNNLLSTDLIPFVDANGLISLKLVADFQSLIESFIILINSSKIDSDLLFEKISKIATIANEIANQGDVNQLNSNDHSVALREAIRYALTTTRYFATYNTLIPKVLMERSTFELCYTLCDLISVSKLNEYSINSREILNEQPQKKVVSKDFGVRPLKIASKLKENSFVESDINTPIANDAPQQINFGPKVKAIDLNEKSVLPDSIYNESPLKSKDNKISNEPEPKEQATGFFSKLSSKLAFAPSRTNSSSESQKKTPIKSFESTYANQPTSILNEIQKIKSLTGSDLKLKSNEAPEFKSVIVVNPKSDLKDFPTKKASTASNSEQGLKEIPEQKLGYPQSTSNEISQMKSEVTNNVNSIPKDSTKVKSINISNPGQILIESNEMRSGSSEPNSNEKPEMKLKSHSTFSNFTNNSQDELEAFTKNDKGPVDSSTQVAQEVNKYETPTNNHTVNLNDLNNLQPTEKSKSISTIASKFESTNSGTTPNNTIPEESLFGVKSSASKWNDTSSLKSSHRPSPVGSSSILSNMKRFEANSSSTTGNLNNISKDSNDSRKISYSSTSKKVGFSSDSKPMEESSLPARTVGSNLRTRLENERNNSAISTSDKLNAKTYNSTSSLESNEMDESSKQSLNSATADEEDESHSRHDNSSDKILLDPPLTDTENKGVERRTNSSGLNHKPLNEIGNIQDSRNQELTSSLLKNTHQPNKIVKIVSDGKEEFSGNEDESDEQENSYYDSEDEEIKRKQDQRKSMAAAVFNVDLFDIDDPDNSLTQVLLYLEHQTVEVISTIQTLLIAIKKPNATQVELREKSRAITLVISQMTEATNTSMNQSRNAQLKEHGSWVVKSLEDCDHRMTILCKPTNNENEEVYADKAFRQRLAGISFDIAKCTKELVKTVEEASLKEDIEYLNNRLKHEV